MTDTAKRDQVVEDVITELVARFHMVYMQVVSGTAILAAPAVTIQHLLPQSFVGLGIQLQTRPFRSQ